MTLIQPIYNEKFWPSQPMDEQEINQKMENFYAQAITLNLSYWGEADIDLRFKVGDAALWNDIYGNLPLAQRRMFNFNRIRRVINMPCGYQRQHRKSITCIPVENSDAETADQFTQVILWSLQQNNGLQILSQAFEGALTTGMNLLHMWMDYRRDPINGDIVIDNLPYNAFLIDPYFKKHDLSDCTGIWTRKWVTKQEAISLLPSQREYLESISSYGNRDGKFQYQPESYNYGMQNLLPYDEFWYPDIRHQKLLVDMETGETMEWRGKPEGLKSFLSQYPQVQAIDNQIQTVRLAIRVNGKVVYNGANPMGTDRYPFVPVLGYYEPQIPYFPWRVQGIVRSLRDSQYLYNRRKVIELDILESQINSGWKYKENALVNPRDIFLTGQGRGLALKQEASMADVERIDAPGVPQSMIELSRMLGEEIMQISGINEELLGSAQDDKAGILAQLRQGAGLTTLQTLFDQLDYSQKLVGQLYIDMIQSNFSPGKIQRIIGKQPTQQFYSKAFGKYDVAIEEGLNTSTQRQMQFTQLLALREAGLPIPSDILVDASTLQNKKQLVDALKAQEESQAQSSQMEQQLAMATAQANIANIQAQAKANIGLGLERASRVEENRALAIERIAEAEKDKEMANLNLVKAIKELESIDLSQLEQMLRLAQYLKGKDTVEETVNRIAVKTPSMEELAVASSDQS